jgi:hypothetical protein
MLSRALLYHTALVRSVIALHNLVNNKIQFRDIEDVLDRSAEGLSEEKHARAPKAKPAEVASEESKPVP